MRKLMCCFYFTDEKNEVQQTVLVKFPRSKLSCSTELAIYPKFSNQFFMHQAVHSVLKSFQYSQQYLGILIVSKILAYL